MDYLQRVDNFDDYNRKEGNNLDLPLTPISHSIENIRMSVGRSSEMYGEEIPYCVKTDMCGEETYHQKTIGEEIQIRDNSSSSSDSDYINTVELTIEERIPISKEIDFVIIDDGFHIPGKTKCITPISLIKNDFDRLNQSQRSGITNSKNKIRRKSSIKSKNSSKIKIKKILPTLKQVSSLLTVDKTSISQSRNVSIQSGQQIFEQAIEIIQTPVIVQEFKLPSVVPKNPLLEFQLSNCFNQSHDKQLLYNQVLNNSSRKLIGQSLNAYKQDFKEKPLVINIVYTQYEVMQDVANETNFTLSNDEEEDWDIWWIDSSILPTLIYKMKWYQRTNHLPAIENLARKNLLAKHLSLMQKLMPEQFNFFPQTWVLPADSKSFKDQFNGKRAKTFIIKPQYNCQGIGIFLTRNYEWIENGEHYVAQKYMHKPFLIDGLKFDLRLYVLITGISPLRCFIYKEGLARFATRQYLGPNGTNLGDLCMHLTNYAINKEAKDFQQNTDAKKDDIGHKRSINSILKHIDRIRNEENGLPTSDYIWQEIKEICVKTLLAGIHHIEHLYRSSKPADLENSLCFQIFGMDVMLDQYGKPWLLEVNHSPSFMTDSPLDYNIKKNVLRDTLHMLNLSQKRKNNYLNQWRNEQEKRLIDFTKVSAKQKLAEKETQRQKKLAQKDEFENSNMGDFQNLYPLPRGVNQEQDKLMDLYDLIYLKKSRQVYEESLAGGAIQKAKKEEPLPLTLPQDAPPRKRDHLRTSQTTALASPKKSEKVHSFTTAKIAIQSNTDLIQEPVIEKIESVLQSDRVLEYQHQTPKSILSAIEGKYYMDGLMIAKLKNYSLLTSPQPTVVSSDFTFQSPKEDPRLKVLQYNQSRKIYDNEKKQFMIKDIANKYLIDRTNRESQKSDLNSTSEKFYSFPTTRSSDIYSQVTQHRVNSVSQYAPEIKSDKKGFPLSPSGGNPKGTLKAQFPLKKQTIAQMQLQLSQKNNLGKNLQSILNEMEQSFKAQQTQIQSPKKAQNIHLTMHQANLDHHSNHIMRSNKLTPLIPQTPGIDSRNMNLVLHGNSYASATQHQQ